MAGPLSYDHPAFLARFPVLMGATTAGANGTSLEMNFPFATRIRNATATVVTAGTSAGTGHKGNLFVGTASVGTIALNTLTAGQTGTSGDMNTLIAASTRLALKNGTDATGVARVAVEMQVDPSASLS